MQPVPPTFLNRPHVLLLGMSGMGKSTRLRAIAEQEIRNGHGLALIDPHGDLAAEVVALVPRRRRNDLIIIDALEPTAAPSLNPLANVAPANRALVASHVLGAFKRLSGSSWGFRTEHILRAAVLAVLETRAPTLIDVERMLFDEAHRRWVLGQVKDERVLRFWLQEFPGYGRLAGEAVAAPANKLAAILASPSVRTMVTKSRPRFDARRALDLRRIIVASLPKGRVGDEVTLLGSFLLARLQQAAMSRANVPPAERHPFTIVVDEIANFASGSLVEMLAECRKYGIKIAAAAQSLAIMPEETRAALLGNSGHLVVYRVRGEDGDMLSRELVRFGTKTLTSLDVGERIERLGGQDAVILGPGS